MARGRRRGGHPGVVSLADVCFEPGMVAASLHAALREWLGLRVFSARRAAGWSWAEPRAPL